MICLQLEFSELNLLEWKYNKFTFVQQNEVVKGKNDDKANEDHKVQNSVDGGQGSYPGL